MAQKIDRTCEWGVNNQGCKMQIVKYNSARDIDVKFFKPKEAIVNNLFYRNFKTGRIKNPYYPSVYNVAFTGQKYPTTLNGKQLKEYHAWHSMLGRCYDKKYQAEKPTYINTIVCEEWLNYENFYEWIHSQKNFDKWKNNEGYAIDKDILVKHNKIYSPYTCCLVPKHINSLFTKNDAIRGDYPIGVTYNKHNNQFVAWCSDGEKQVFIGDYFAPNDAFEAYKKYKEKVIKRIAHEAFKNGEITRECYEAMLKYEVEITD